MDKIDCIVCNKLFEPAIIVGEELDNENLLMQSDNLCCSSECKAKHDRTVANEKINCFYCQKIVAKKDTAYFLIDCEHEVMTRVCNSCLEKKF